MTRALLNLLLAVIWLFLTGSFTIMNFLVGLVLGYLVLVVVRPLLEPEAGEERARQRIRPASVPLRVWYQFKLLVLFFVDLFLSSLRVAWEVLTPGYSMKAGIIAVPMDVSSDFGITLFANHISLTPGTLSLDTSEDRNLLFIHAMYVDEDIDSERIALKRTTEQRVIDALGSASQRPSSNQGEV